MSLRIAVLQHERETGLGTIATLLDNARVDYQGVETLCGRLPDHVPFDGAIALGGSLNAHDPRLLETRRWIRNGVLTDAADHFDALMIGLRRATPRLGALAGQLLQRWLHLVVSRREAAA